MRGACEALGIVLVVAGLLAAWLPLGLMAAGTALIFAAHAPGPAARPAESTSRSAEIRRRAA